MRFKPYKVSDKLSEAYRNCNKEGTISKEQIQFILDKAYALFGRRTLSNSQNYDVFIAKECFNITKDFVFTRIVEGVLS